MADLLTSIRAEIDARLRELAPAIAEYERLSTAAAALAAEGRTASRPAELNRRDADAHPAPPRARASSTKARAPKARAPKARAPAGAARRVRKREQPAHTTATAQAILAALEHGSHTLAELVMVTALRAPDIREALRHLRTRGAIVKTDRDGKAAYALPA